MNENIGIQDLEGSRSSTRAKTASGVVVMLVATLIGIPAGLLTADQDLLNSIRQDLGSQVDCVRRYLVISPDTASAQPQTPEIIQTGLSSIAAIHYSSKPGYAHVAFDLEAVELVRTGKLGSPDRIYVDLKDRHRGQGTLRREKAQKAISLAGDLLTGVRISQREQGALRIVFDLKSPCDFTYQTSPGPHSGLVVEIQSAVSKE